MNTLTGSSGVPGFPSAQEEDAYAMAYGELGKQDSLRAGLWAKALAESDGNSQAAETHYLRWRSAQIMSQSGEAVIARPASTEQPSDDQHAGPFAPTEEKKVLPVSNDDSWQAPLFALSLIVALIVASVVASRSGGASSAAPSAMAPAPQEAPPAAPAEASQESDKTSPAKTSTETTKPENSTFSFIFAEVSLDSAANKYVGQPWHSCAEEMAKTIKKWRGSGYRQPSGGKQITPGMEVSELRRDATAYGTEFTLHIAGVDLDGDSFAGSHLCHMGKGGQLLSFQKVQL